ncbi:MarR family winged helix-turn-helix transcriptional regulator [Ruania albidiflava]|uniref:MarR family winged helix-turn-helix transcriptional regulator n=1 Tax=Ruania albidiflava TaxID=366586 RepID=UPI0003F9AE02|nr:MarR family transcriptional regulator [Ruania albidiflava]
MTVSDPVTGPTGPAPAPAAGTLGPDLLAVIARLNRWATSQANLEIPAAQARLLAAVEQIGPARTSDLARLDSSSQPTITAQLQRAEQDGWVRRTPDPSDGRASLVALTDAGRAVLGDVRRARAQVLAGRLDELSATERDVLTQAIAVVERLLDGP